MSDLIMFYKIYYNKTCVRLPQYYKPVTNEDSDRLRKTIKPPDYLYRNEKFNLENLRQTKNNSLSVKCMTEVKHNVFKNSYFFRSIHEWYRIPVEIRSALSIAVFEENLCSYFWKEISKCELEPD